jgi:hypothetical protein
MPDAGAAPAIIKLCARLAGIPLAIEPAIEEQDLQRRPRIERELLDNPASVLGAAH